MVESRCGILCENCSFRETMGCKGCLNIKNPFWGSCPVKNCCESKNHTHCGQCGEFVCQQLNAFAYDPKQGDNGLRLEQCRKWSEVS